MLYITFWLLADKANRLVLLLSRSMPSPKTNLSDVCYEVFLSAVMVAVFKL